MSRLRVEEVILVEGKYDAVKLADLVDGLILTTDGFSIFHNKAARQLILELGKKRGILVLTDSDAAGFRIRNYINQFARGVGKKCLYPGNCGEGTAKSGALEGGPAGRGRRSGRGDPYGAAHGRRARTRRAHRPRHHICRFV